MREEHTMFETFLLGLVVILAIVAFVVASSLRRIGTKRNEQEYLDAVPWVRGVGVGILVIALVFAFFAFTFQVGAKHYGVLTSFGKTQSADYGPGIHFKLPWEKDTSVD